MSKVQLDARHKQADQNMGVGFSEAKLGSSKNKSHMDTFHANP
jgi:hypothetical protein